MRIWKPGQPETLLFMSSPYSSDSFSSSFEGGGVLVNAWRRHPSRFFPYGNWDGGRTRTPTPENRTEPVQGTRLRDVHGHKVPSGTSVGTLINW